MKMVLTEKEMSGMTVNERLYLSGLINEFDEAIAQNDKLKLKSILEKLHLSQENVQIIIDEELK